MSHRTSLAGPPGPAALTTPEIQVLRRIADGCNVREIAEERGTTPGTVKNQLSSAYRKLGARDRTQAVVLAIRGGRTPGEPHCAGPGDRLVHD